MALLSPYRVLDLCDERGQLTGLILAQLGADVIVVEPPRGSPARRRAPFGPDGKSLVWAAWNRGKRSVALDLLDPADRRRFLELAAGADVIVESSSPGELAALGLAYSDVARTNPLIVYASITPFGSDGPKAGWAATAMTVWAAAGPMALTGDSDRPPLSVPGDQAFLHAAGDAAGAVVAALIERASSGKGQRLTVSAQQASAIATQAQILSYPLGDEMTQRTGGGSVRGKLVNRYMYPATDGQVTITFGFGSSVGPFTTRLIEWMYEEGFCDEATRDKDWIGFAARLTSGEEPIEEYERVKDLVARFTATKTKAELFEAAMPRKLLIAPVATTEDVVGLGHFAERGYWDDVDGVRYPGRWAHMTEAPLCRLGNAPRVGEHNDSMFAEPRRRVALTNQPSGESANRPLSGLKVLDFTWSMAGPVISRALADYGATVVHVESATRYDTARTLRPFVHGAGQQVSGAYSDFNAGKLDIAVNMATAEGRGVALDLVRWADVVCESFSPRAMRSWGFDYESLRAVKHDLVMLSSSLLGQTGPLANYAGFGNTAASLAGFTNITGWPDRDPAGPYSAYTDYVSPRFATTALLAAVDHHRRTGEGTYIDLSQTEAAMMFLTPALLDFTVNGHVWTAMGNRDLDFVPHAVSPAAGEDRWVAIACTTDTEWRALANIIGRTDLADLDTDQRRTREDEIEAAIAAWTGSRSELEVESRCQSAGVPAHRVQNSKECWEDPQLAHLRHFREVSQAVTGTTWVEAPRVAFSRTPAEIGWAGPELGEHTWEVLTELLGYEPGHIASLMEAGALE